MSNAGRPAPALLAMLAEILAQDPQFLQKPWAHLPQPSPQSRVQRPQNVPQPEKQRPQPVVHAFPHAAQLLSDAWHPLPQHTNGSASNATHAHAMQVHTHQKRATCSRAQLAQLALGRIDTWPAELPSAASRRFVQAHHDLATL